ncbi:unnamed protein product [Protopolystoma xenopodis]|uniref:Uncharacterized protein n=1 Tax=Protopolystoma xenopodis TaxID=117903 RepID=A0A448WB49_9PLAT|nr:unnamed protein product [Protopolystoma xenopodis]
MAATVHSGAPATPGDDPGVAASASVAAVEQALCMTRAGQAAMDAVIGSGASLLGRTIRVCRQFYLRQM